MMIGSEEYVHGVQIRVHEPNYSTRLDELVSAITFGRQARHSSITPLEWLMRLGLASFHVFDDATTAKIIRLLFESGEINAYSRSIIGSSFTEFVSLYSVAGRVEILRAFADNGVMLRCKSAVEHARIALRGPDRSRFMRASVKAGYVIDGNDGSLKELFRKTKLDVDDVNACRLVLAHTTTMLKPEVMDSCVSRARPSWEFDHPVFREMPNLMAFVDPNRYMYEIVEMMKEYRKELNVVCNMAVLRSVAEKLSDRMLGDVLEYAYALVLR